MFRRKELPEELRPVSAAFMRVLDELEPAKVAMTDVLPGTRMPGRPLSDALDEYERRLVAASELMLEAGAPPGAADLAATGRNGVRGPSDDS